MTDPQSVPTEPATVPARNAAVAEMFQTLSDQVLAVARQIDPASIGFDTYCLLRDQHLGLVAFRTSYPTLVLSLRQMALVLGGWEDGVAPRTGRSAFVPISPEQPIQLPPVVKVRLALLEVAQYLGCDVDEEEIGRWPGPDRVRAYEWAVARRKHDWADVPDEVPVPPKPDFLP